MLANMWRKWNPCALGCHMLQSQGSDQNNEVRDMKLISHFEHIKNTSTCGTVLTEN